MNSTMEARMFKAASSGNIAEMNGLEVEESNLIHSRFHNENTVMHVAARMGHTMLVQHLIRKHHFLVKEPNKKGEIPIHLAARADRWSVVRSFITQVDNGIEIAIKVDNKGNTPLPAAAKNGCFSVVLLMAHRYPQVLLIQNDIGETPLSIALDNRWTGIVEEMIRLRPVALQYRKFDGQNPLHRAVIRCDLGNMSLILEKKKDLAKQQDGKKMTPLHYAAALGNYKMVKALIDDGRHGDSSATYTAEINGQIPLHLAAKSCGKSLFKLLIHASADTIEMVDNNKKNILHLAAENGNLELVTYILKLPEMEDLANSQDGNGNTPLHLAAKNFHYYVVGALSKNLKIQPRVVNHSNMSALASCLSTKDNGMDLEKYLTFKALKSSYKTRGINRQDRSEFYNYNLKGNSKSKQMAQTITVMAMMIASFTFAAVFTVPGGVKHDTPQTPQEGTAVLVHQKAFQAFIISNTIAMTTSITAAVIVFWSSSRRDKEAFMDTLPFAIGLTWVSMIAMTAAFVSGLFVVLRNQLWLAILVCSIGCLAPFMLYIVAPMFLILYEKFCSTQAFLHHRIIGDNPFHFMFRLMKMLF